MGEILYFGFIGVAPGAMIGLVAIGLVLIYRTTGVLNLAHTGQASLGAYTYYELTTSAGLAPLLSVAAAAAIAGGSGVLIQILVMRPLEGAAVLTRVIASTAILVIIQSALLIRFGSDSLSAPSLLPTGPVRLWGSRAIGADRIWLLAIALVIVACAWSLYRYTFFGIVTAAVAENPMVASTLGHDSNRVSVVNWFLGGGLAGIAGALLAPITGLNVLGFTALLVPVLVAALGGGLTSLPLTLLAGIVIGVAQAEATSQTSVRGADTIAIFALLMILMLIRGEAIPTRGRAGGRLPAVGMARLRPAVLICAAGVFLLGVWFVADAAWNQALLTSALMGLPLLSIVVVTGYAGQLSLAQYTLAGLGAVMSTQAMIHAGLSFVPAIVIGGIAAIPVGYALSLVARRMRGVSLAVLTLGFNVLIYSTVFTSQDYVIVSSPSVFGIDLTSLLDPRRYLTLVVVFVVLFSFGVSVIRRGALGRRMLAVRGNERAAASVGISANSTKATAFVVAAFIAAVGGGLIAFRSTAVTYSSFGVLDSLTMLGWSVIGGVGYVSGPLFGSAFVNGGVGNQIIASLYNDQFSWLPLLGGVLVLLTVLLNPDGVASKLPSFERIRGRRKGDGAHGGELKVQPDRAEYARERRSLHIEGLKVSFGSVEVLRGVDVSVHPGTIHGLIGANGAGKTTLLDCVSGFVRGSEGSIRVGDVEVSDRAPWERSRSGIGRSFQSLELFEDMTVFENLYTAYENSGARDEQNRRHRGLRQLVLAHGQATVDEEFADVVDLLGLSPKLGLSTRDLSNGDRHLVAIARALVTNADVILLDEPTAGLDDHGRTEFRALITRVVDAYGIGVLVIEHDVEMIMSISSIVTALSFGEVIATGPPEVVRAHPTVVSAYLGSTARDGYVAPQQEAPAAMESKS